MNRSLLGLAMFLFIAPAHSMTATVTTAGRISGKMIYLNTWKLLLPSMRAASSNSRGIDMMNWRSRKMYSGPPNR